MIDLYCGTTFTDSMQDEDEYRVHCDAEKNIRKLYSDYKELQFVNASFTSSSIDSPSFLQQWVDLARYTGLQIQKKEAIKDQVANTSDVPLLECSATQINNTDESNNQVQLLECSTTKINNMDENNNQSGDTPT